MRGYWLSSSGTWKFNRHYQQSKINILDKIRIFQGKYVEPVKIRIFQGKYVEPVKIRIFQGQYYEPSKIRIFQGRK